MALLGSGVATITHAEQPAKMSNTTTINNTTVTDNSTPTSTGTVGYWGGVWYNESFTFDNNPDAYLNKSQISKLTNRTIARVEVLRNDTFNSRPKINIVTRKAYKSQSSGYTPRTGSYKNWNNIVWKSVFIVNETTNVENELKKLYGGQVRAFYSSSSNSVYIIVAQDQTDLVKFNPTALAHELVHAYQDQKVGLNSKQFQRKTQDGSLAKDSVIEGEAMFIEKKFKQQCKTGNWDCYEPSDGESTTGGRSMNIGLQVTAYFPYSDGRAYIAHKYNQGGWAKVNHTYYNVPTHTSQIIHYKQKTNPITVNITDTSESKWLTYDYGRNGYERVGEATLATMVWYQNYRYGIDTGVTQNDFIKTSDNSYYNYNFSSTNGLRGDAVLPYFHAENKNKTGYVFKTVWESKKDRKEFEAVYRTILEGHNGKKHTTKLPGTVYALPNGSGYSGVYYITSTNNTLTITHSESLKNIKEIQGINQKSEEVVDNKQPKYKQYLKNISPFTLIVLGGSIILFLLLGIKIWWVS